MVILKINELTYWLDPRRYTNDVWESHLSLYFLLLDIKKRVSIKDRYPFKFLDIYSLFIWSDS